MAKSEEEIKPTVTVTAPKEKMYTFDQWAMIRSKKSSHLPGMRAWLGSKVLNRYSLETWDTLMSGY